LLRVCETMRGVPVFGDEYWRLKARRNELRAGCDAAWLAATGCDGSRYDPVFRDGWPEGWRERWRVIREFTERWYGIPMRDAGGRQEEIRAEERRLGRELPAALPEFIAFLHDLDRQEEPRFGFHHIDTTSAIEMRDVLSLMINPERNLFVWAILRLSPPRNPIRPVIPVPVSAGTEWFTPDADDLDAVALPDFVLSRLFALLPTTSPSDASELPLSRQRPPAIVARLSRAPTLCRSALPSSSPSAMLPPDPVNMEVPAMTGNPPSDDAPFFNLDQARWLVGSLDLLIRAVGRESLLGLILRQTRSEIDSIVTDEEAGGSALPRNAFYEQN
jgi:hypothetical protein